MKKDWLTKIEVDKKVKSIHSKNRRPVDLIIGGYYYVSFGMNTATRCTLVAIEKRPGSVDSITIDIPTKASRRGILTVGGKSYRGDRHSIFADEIGLTPEQAVIHTVTT